MAPRRAKLVTLRAAAGGEPIDRALALSFPSPASATGEDVVEFHCHGSPAVVDRLLAEAMSLPGVRMAEPGEFTLRAVLSGKMGLADAEALADLIDARTEAERRRALRLSEGALSARLMDWRARLVALLALCEAHIDFADEGDVGDGAPAIDGEAEALRAEISATLSASRDADKLTDGFRIVLVGPPNAGKSSLINALAGRRVALVSPMAGTTRDVVSVTLDLGGFRAMISDTAGLRGGTSGIEAMGIERTEEELAAADLVVEVRSPDTDPLFYSRADLVVGHKADLGLLEGVDLATDIARPASIEALAERLTKATVSGLRAAESSLVTRGRQRSGLLDVASGLGEACSAAHLEIKAEALRSACHAMARLTGDIGVEDILDDVFGRFCIGK